MLDILLYGASPFCWSLPALIILRLREPEYAASLSAYRVALPGTILCAAGSGSTASVRVDPKSLLSKIETGAASEPSALSHLVWA